MEAGENHACKRPRGGGEIARHESNPSDGAGAGGREGKGAAQPWHHPSNRIYRVSRATGGKDRHSKVYTARGLRDRRVRLSVSTAIQFYDLQDRLGCDQPSKAIEWLIKAAASAIAELPTLETSFPDHPVQDAKNEMGLEAAPGDDAGMDMDHGDNSQQPQQQQQQQQHLSLSKSGCSSTSETSKGSVLSLSRTESRIKARERARERAAKEQHGGDVAAATDSENQAAINNTGLNSQGSFTELLTGASNNEVAVNPCINCNQKAPVRYMPVAATADYLTQAGLFGQGQKASHRPPLSGFVSQAHLGGSSPIGMVPVNIATAAAAAAAAGNHPEMQQFSFLQDPPIPITAVGPGDYNLNFFISSGLAGLNRGTLQSNSPFQLPLHHHHQQQQQQQNHHHNHLLQRLSSSVDGSNLPFSLGTTAPSTAAATSAQNQFSAGFDGRLHFCYNEEYRHSDMKGKGKN